MTSEQPDRAVLLKVLKTRFDEEDLRELCFVLHIDYDSLRGGNKVGKARELILYCEQRSRIKDLVEYVRQERPDALPKISTPTPTTPPERPLKGQHILLVEDDFKLGQTLTSLLWNGGAIVEHREGLNEHRRWSGFGDGDVAPTTLELLQERLAAPPIPDTVLISSVLEGSSGVDLASWMATQPHLRGVLRVLLSNTQNVEASSATLFHDHIVKTTPSDQMVTQLRDLFLRRDLLINVSSTSMQVNIPLLASVAGKRSILLVERFDLLFSQRTILRVIMEGYDYIALIKSAHVLDYLTVRPVPLVITNDRLYDMDGIELAAAMKRQAPNTRVLLTSVYLSREQHARAVEVGVDYFLSKPFDYQEVARIIYDATKADRVVVDNTKMLAQAQTHRRQLMLNPEEIAAQQELLTTHCRTLAHLVKQAAYFSPGHLPAHIASGIDEARVEIARIKAVLRDAGVTVAAHPDDEAPVAAALQSTPAVPRQERLEHAILAWVHQASGRMIDHELVARDLVIDMEEVHGFLKILAKKGLIQLFVDGTTLTPEGHVVLRAFQAKDT
jgi:DNA-binding NarL/FixJ family response regulator